MTIEDVILYLHLLLDAAVAVWAVLFIRYIERGSSNNNS